jgi:hypothetical protein
MSQKWIKGSEKALKRLEELSKEEDKDRLESAKTIKTAISLMGRSLSGWGQWVNNPAAIANFSQEELEVIEDTILELAKSFIEYDIEITQEGIEKGLGRKQTGEEKIQFII